jgi:hypothetical protein
VGTGDRCACGRHGAVSVGPGRARRLTLVLGLDPLGLAVGTVAVVCYALRSAQLMIQMGFPIFQFFSNYLADPILQNKKMVLSELQKFPTLTWW